MNPDQQNDEILTITRDTLDDCYEDLAKMYGSPSAYSITGRRNTVQKYGIGKLFKKPGVRLSYKLNRRPKSEDEFPSDPEANQRAH